MPSEPNHYIEGMKAPRTMREAFGHYTSDRLYPMAYKRPKSNYLGAIAGLAFMIWLMIATNGLGM